MLFVALIRFSCVRHRSNYNASTRIHCGVKRIRYFILDWISLEFTLVPSIKHQLTLRKISVARLKTGEILWYLQTGLPQSWDCFKSTRYLFKLTSTWMRLSQYHVKNSLEAIHRWWVGCNRRSNRFWWYNWLRIN